MSGQLLFDAAGAHRCERPSMSSHGTGSLWVCECGVAYELLAHDGWLTGDDVQQRAILLALLR